MFRGGDASGELLTEDDPGRHCPVALHPVPWDAFYGGLAEICNMQFDVVLEGVERLMAERADQK